MSAVVIMRELLIARSQVATKVPAARVFIGATPQGVLLPAVAVSDVGGNEIRTIARNGPTSTVRNRVQVTVYARTYEDQERLLLACKLGAGVHTGTVRGYKVKAVEPMGTNPAIPPGDDKIYERSRDFMVTFTEAN